MMWSRTTANTGTTHIILLQESFAAYLRSKGANGDANEDANIDADNSSNEIMLCCWEEECARAR